MPLLHLYFLFIVSNDVPKIWKHRSTREFSFPRYLRSSRYSFQTRIEITRFSSIVCTERERQFSNPLEESVKPVSAQKEVIAWHAFARSFQNVDTQANRLLDSLTFYENRA